jgi:carboxylesterase type B
MIDIQQKLDMLDEFYCQKDSIENEKRALLDEVKIPAEVLAVQQKANEEAQAYASKQRKSAEQVRAECAAKLAEIKVPDEVREILARIDHERGLVMSYQREKESEIEQDVEQKRTALFNKAQFDTAKVYAEIEARKKEIAAEFAGKEQAAAENIAKLEAEIKAEVKAFGKSVKGNHFHAVYNKGRITWNTDKMEAWIVDHPFLKDARKEGEPSISIRRI